jgi:hypothetical protein
MTETQVVPAQPPICNQCRGHDGGHVDAGRGLTNSRHLQPDLQVPGFLIMQPGFFREFGRKREKVRGNIDDMYGFFWIGELSHLVT